MSLNTHAENQRNIFDDGNVTLLLFLHTWIVHSLKIHFLNYRNI